MPKKVAVLIKDKDIAVPGECLAEGMDYLPGNGTYREGEKILASRLGLTTIDGRAIKLIPLSGRYLPKRGDTIIGEITDKDVILVRPNTTLEDAIKLMLEMDRNTLPVVDSEVVGYISYTDILRLVNRIEATPIEEEEEFDPTKYII